MVLELTGFEHKPDVTAPMFLLSLAKAVLNGCIHGVITHELQDVSREEAVQRLETSGCPEFFEGQERNWRRHDQS